MIFQYFEPLVKYSELIIVGSKIKTLPKIENSGAIIKGIMLNSSEVGKLNPVPTVIKIAPNKIRAETALRSGRDHFVYNKSMMKKISIKKSAQTRNPSKLNGSTSNTTTQIIFDKVIR